MKKIILPAIVSACFLVSSANAVENNFFVKTNMILSKLNKVNGFKSNKDIVFGIGAGYNYMDNVRFDLTFDHFVNPKLKGGGKTISGNINTLLLNSFVDLADISVAKVFIGAGVGFGQVQAKISGDEVKENNGKSKKKNSPAYALYLGASVQLAQNITAEITYSYRSLGKTKKINNSNVKFHGNHLGAGIRFDL